MPKETGETLAETWGNILGNEGNTYGVATRQISEPLSHQPFNLLYT